MSQFSDRSVRVVLARPRTGGGTEPNGIEIRNLRVGFSIEKTLESKPNLGSLTLYNLSDATVTAFTKKPIKITVEAGYGTDLSKMFFGDLRWAQTVTQGTDNITTIECGDGERAYRHARHNKSYSAGVEPKQIVNDLLASMDLKVPKSVGEARELLDKLTGGFSAVGPSSAQLDKMLKPRGLSWSVQNGNAQIIRNNSGIESAYIVSEDTGMIGTPEYGAPAEDKKQPRLTVQTLLRPEIGPGQLIRVESRRIRGNFRVEKIRHSGDTHGQDWYTTIEAKSL